MNEVENQTRAKKRPHTARVPVPCRDLDVDFVPLGWLWSALQGKGVLGGVQLFGSRCALAEIKQGVLYLELTT
jgi:hypothetical protein